MKKSKKKKKVKKKTGLGKPTTKKTKFKKKFKTANIIYLTRYQHRYKGVADHWIATDKVNKAIRSERDINEKYAENWRVSTWKINFEEGTIKKVKVKGG